MEFGKYIKSLRDTIGLSQRELSKVSGISNAEISRIETGIRKKPAVAALKALAPNLGVDYIELLRTAGYIEGEVENERDTYNSYREENDDIIGRMRYMYEKDSQWAEIACTVAISDLKEEELNVIKAVTESLLEQFLKNKKK